MPQQEKQVLLTEEFPVLNSRGELKMVQRWQQFIRLSTIDGGWTKWRPTAFELSIDGRHVNPTKDPDVFQMFDTDEKLTVIPRDPQATDSRN